MPVFSICNMNSYLVSQAIHPFNAESEKELCLAVGDYVVVRKVFFLFV